MDNLSFDWNVLILLNFSFLGDVFDLSFWDVLRNVLSEIFDGIVIGDGNFPRDLLDSNFFSVFGNFSSLGYSLYSAVILIFNDFLFERNVFDSALAFNHFFSSVDCSVDNLRLMGYICVSNSVPSV